MNRTGRRLTSRLSTPSRSTLDTSEWYNALYQSLADSFHGYNDDVKQSIEERKKTYQDTNFGRFMDAANSGEDDLLKLKFLNDDQIESIDEIVVTPENKEYKTPEEKNKQREMLKTKKWLSGLSGEEFTDQDEKELDDLDRWHSIIYSSTEYKNKYSPYKYTPNTIQERAEYEAKERLRNLAKNSPKGYWLKSALKLPYLWTKLPFVLDPFNTEGALDWITDAIAEQIMPDADRYNLADDLATSFHRKVNEVQIDDSKGKIQRVQEMQLLAKNGLEDLLGEIQRNDDARIKLSQLQREQEYRDLNEEELNELNRLQEQVQSASFREAVAEGKLNTLAQYESWPIIGQAWEKMNWALNKINFAYDLGVRDDLTGLRNKLYEVYRSRKSGDKYRQLQAIDNLKAHLDNFNKNSQKAIDGWSKDIDDDEKQIEDIDTKYKISSYYEANDQLAQDLSIFSPKKILFSTSGLLGSSMSHVPSQVIKTGTVLASLFTGTAPGYLGAATVNAIAGGAGASSENNAEVGGTFQVSDFVQALTNNGVDDMALKEGRELLGNEDATLNDVVEAFTKGRIQFANRKVRNALLNTIAGANQQWAYDMNATAPGVWTEAALTTIPDAAYAKMLRFGKALSPKALRASLKKASGTFDELVEESTVGLNAIPAEEVAKATQIAAKQGIKDPVIIPLSNPMGITSTGTMRIAEQTAEQLRDKVSLVTKMASYLPKKFLGPKAIQTGRFARSLSTRSIVGMGNEFLEEDVQSIRQHQRANGEYTSDFISGMYNPRLILDNILSGVRSSWDFIFKDPLHATQEELEIWREAKLGALGFLAQGGPNVFIRSAYDTWKQYKADDVALTNIRATKAEDDALIEKGILFARNAKSPQDYQRMVQALDDIESANRARNEKFARTKNQDDAGFPDEFMAQNKELYKKIYNLYHNAEMQEAAKNSGIDVNSDDYAQFVSIMARQADIYKDAIKNHENQKRYIQNQRILAESEQSFVKWLEDNNLLYTRDKKQKKSGKGRHPITEQHREELRKQYLQEVEQKFQLAELGAVVELYEQYSAIAEQTQRQSEVAKSMKEALDELNERRKKAGQKEIKSKQDVEDLVKDIQFHNDFKSEYAKLYGFITDRNIGQDIWLDALEGKEVVENGKRKRIYTGKRLVDRYKETSKSDRDLQESLEKDYFNTIKRRRDISNWFKEFSLTDTNNVYTGFDGKQYVVKPIQLENGITIVAKYKQGNNGDAEGDPMYFDQEEFYTYHEMVTRDLEKETADDTSDEERLQAGKNRLDRKRNQDMYNRAQEIKMLALQDEEQQQIAESYQLPKSREQELEELEAEAQLEQIQIDRENEQYEAERQQEILSQMEDRPIVEQNIGRPERLFADGWEFKTKKTKRGNTRYYAEKDGREITLSKKEWQIGAELQSQLPEKQEQKSFLSGTIEDYEYDEASYKGVPGSHNAAEELTIKILNAAYSGYEGTFAQLLHQAAYVLTDEQLDDLRLMFAAVNGYFAKEWQSAENVNSIRALNRAHDAIQNAVLKYRTALFKFYRLIAEYDEDSLKDFIQNFVKQAGYKPQGAKSVERELLKSKNEGISKALQIIGLVKSKFHLHQKGNKFFATFATGEEYKLTKLEYEFAMFMKDALQPKQMQLNLDDPIDSEDSGVFEKDYSKFEQTQTAEQFPIQIKDIPSVLRDVAMSEEINSAERLSQIINIISSIVTPTSSRRSESQEQIINTLFQYDKELNPDILHDVTSSLHYFIIIDGKVTPYERVHTFLKPDFETYLKNASSIFYEDAVQIRDAINSASTYEEYVSLINKYQNRWNDELAKRYPIGSNTFNKRCIDLAGYTYEDIYNYFKNVAADAVANIAALGKIKNDDGSVQVEIPIVTSAVDAGNVVDEIARKIFSNKFLQNEVRYKMQDDVFNRLVEDIKKRKKQLESVGIKVLTNEICTFAEIEDLNGVKRRVAGVMDMVAVDKFGNVYIIDFKTTSSSTYFERAIKGPYRAQITVYSRLLETQHPNVTVRGLYIAPVKLIKEEHKNPTTNRKDPNVYAGIKQTSVEKLIKIEKDPRFLDKSAPAEEISYDEIDSKTNELKTRFNKAHNYIIGQFGNIPTQLQQEYSNILASIQNLDNAINSLKNENAVPEQALFDEIMFIMGIIEDFAHDVKSVVQQQQTIKKPQTTGGIPNNPTAHAFVWEDKGATGELIKYNNIDVRVRPHGIDQNKWEDFKRVSALPDFIESSIWELNVSHYIREMGTLMVGSKTKNPTILVSIKYTEHKPDGTTVDHVFGNMMLQVAQVLSDGTVIQNQRTQNPLIQKIDSLLFDRDPATGNLIWKKDSYKIRVVLKGKSRTNGKILYDYKKRQPIDQAFKLRTEEIEGLLNDGGNNIGEISVIVNGSPARILKTSTQRSRTTIYNIPEGRGLPDGIMALVLKLPYTEDSTPVHLPVVPLTPKVLHNTDVDLIMDILTNISKYARSYKINIGGKQYQSPVDVWKILSSLIRFGEAARQTKSRFVFDFAKTNGQPDHNIVEMTQYGTTNIVQYDLRIPEQKDALRKEIAKATVYYNNEFLLRHGTSTKLDSTDNLFKGLQKFFEDHPDINSISYSKSMTFNRSDVDPDGDGSYKGITGFHWMVNHGWFQSDYAGIELPLMSATDAEVETLIEPETSNTVKIEGFLNNIDESEQNPIVVRDGLTGNGVDDPFAGSINYNDANDASALFAEDTGEKLFKIQSKRSENQIDIETAKRRIQRILGKNFPVRFIEDVIQAFANGHIVVGQLNKTGITLSLAAENNVEFHEAFHGVVEILLPDRLRDRLYKHYVEKYANDRKLDNVAIAEGLADLYYEFKQNSPEIRLTWNIAKLFKNVFEYSKALASLNDAKMSAMFLATDLGLMRLFKADSYKFENFAKRYSGLNYEIVRKQVVDGETKLVRTPLKNFGNQKSVNDLVEVLLYKLIHDSGVEVLGSNLNRLDTRLGAIATTLMATKEERDAMEEKYIELKPKYGINAWDYIQHSKEFKKLTAEGYTDEQLKKLLQDKKLSPLAYRNTMMFREAFEKWDVFRDLIEQQLRAKAVDAKVRREESQQENMDSGEGFNRDEFGHYDQPFYEHSMRDDVPTRIKFFLSTRPNRRFATNEDVAEGRVVSTHVEITDENGQKKSVRIPVDVRNNSLGYSTYASYQYVYNLLLKTAHKAKTIGELDKLLQKLGESDFILYSIGKNFHRFRRMSYIRYQSEDGGKYRNIPKVTVNGKLLDPSEYISNPKQLTEAEEFPTVVRYTHDVYDPKTQKLLHRQGEIIQNAIIQTNPDYEQLVTQLFQAIHAQKLDFQYTFASPVLQENGKPTGRYSYTTDSTNTDQSMQAYPHIWFDSLRSNWGGIFSADNNGQPVALKTSVFEDAAVFLRMLRGAVSAEAGKINRHNIPINGKYYDILDAEGFDEIETAFVKTLNSVGVEITKQSLNYMLLQKYQYIDNISKAFEEMLTSRSVDSISPFIDSDTGVLDKLQKALNSGNLSIFMNDVKGTNDLSASGSFLYGQNGFLKDLAAWDGKYRLASQETMTLGPDNTKMYTYAQHHSASEDVDALNNVFDDDGNMLQEGLVWDLKQSPYIISDDNKGSIIMREVLNVNFNPTHDRIVLSTCAGVKLNMRGNNGTKYSEISAAEDWLTKAAILQDGHIIFPTLSDKSTWFFLRGIKLPGFDYNNLQTAKLPIFAHTGGYGRMLFNTSDWSKQKQLSFAESNPVLDQLIEYAYRELALVNQTINQLGIQDVNQTLEKHLEEEDKIENFHTKEMHGARFCFLTGVYGKFIDKGDTFELDETSDEFYDFNRYDPKDPVKSVLQSRERAMRVFFDLKPGETNDQLRARQRAMIANILQHRMIDQLNDLVDKGIIERIPSNEYKFSKNGEKTTANSKISDFFGFRNKYLDNSNITKLVEAYKKQPYQNRTYGDAFTAQQLESVAISAYVYDILSKSIMSKEETQRIFTGFPHFFEWKFDEETGQLVDILQDESKRHGGEGSTGTSNILDLANLPSTYRCAEIKDHRISSHIANALQSAFKDNEYRDALVNKMIRELDDKERADTKSIDSIYDLVYKMDLSDVEQQLGDIKDLVDQHIKDESESFSKKSNKSADGTAYITDKMAENLLRMRGAWNSEVKDAFDYLRGNKKDKKDHLNSSKAYRIIMNSLIGTQKYSAYGYRMQNGVPVHFYNKYALFPIFEDIAYGITKILYDKMNDPKYGVDMVMMTSAVKVGSQASQEFNPDMDIESLKNFSFKDHTYVQHYSRIRRQLNTDPHERDKMMMGTQAVKVALSTIRDGQTYTRPDGSTIRGRDLKNSIMSSIKELATIGEKRIVDRFFKDGVLDMTEFAKFAEDQLIDRNADKNILDAVRTLYDNPSAILNSVSNMAWIESIMISMINKNVIDINLPGNAFYQRSVFGMEGIQGDSKYVLNGGKKLQMINEEGSMDAVVSLDFFYNIIPAPYRYNFNKAKQWLIDNDIISGIRSWEKEWHNASANIVAYRIPTQAVSSVHALRIVDVVPDIRDTIILPEEFTTITGSDFDIDKLYCSMINYDVIKSSELDMTEKDTYPKMYTTYEATSKFEKDTDPEKYYQNKLLMDYLMLLKDAGKIFNDENPNWGDENTLGRYIHMLHRSIDNDTDLIKSVLNKVESGQKKTAVEPFVAGSLYTQSNLKSAFITGKFGIGPYALNNNSHILTTLYNVSFKESKYGIMSALNATSLHEYTDRDGNSIMGWMSALINAHVDVAKDPYILRLNVNKYTYNLVSLLIRTGLGKDALYFVDQPILKRLAIDYQNANGDIVDDPSMSPTARSRAIEKEIAESYDYGTTAINTKIKKLYGYGNNKYTEQDFLEDIPIIKALFGIVNNKYTAGSKTILEDLLTNEDILIDKSKGFTIDNYIQNGYYDINGTKYSPKILQGYVFIAKKLFDDYADALGNLVQTTKIDTKKHGISFLEQKEYERRYNELSDKDSNMFDDNLQAMLNDSFIEHKTRIAVGDSRKGDQGLLQKLLSQQLIHFTPRFQQTVDVISNLVNNRTMETKLEIQRQLLAYVKMKCMNRIMDEYGIQFDDIMRGPNNLAQRISALKRKMLSDETGKYSHFASYGVITNSILNNIHPVPYMPTFGQDRYSLLQLDNSIDDDPDIENSYIDSWQQMWESDDEEIKKIALDLAVYAFMTSADNRGFTKFFKYVPLKMRQDIGYVKYMNEMYLQFANGDISITLDGHSFNEININEFLRNNWKSNKIIPIYNPYTKSGQLKIYGHRTIYQDENKANGIPIYRNTWQIFTFGTNKQGKSYLSPNQDGLYPPFIKMRRPFTTSRDSAPYLLYRLATVIKKGNNEFPVYALATQKGLSIKAGSQTFDIYEYDRFDSNPNVMTGKQLDDIDWNEIASNMVDFFVKKAKEDPNFRVSQNQFDRLAYNPKTHQPIKAYSISTNKETGEQTVTETIPTTYTTLLQDMWRTERDIRRIERSSETIDKSQLRYSDRFMKFCKSA